MKTDECSCGDLLILMYCQPILSPDMSPFAALMIDFKMTIATLVFLLNVSKGRNIISYESSVI